MCGKRSKKLILLAGALGIACIVTLVLLGIEQRQEDIRTSGEVILEIPADDVIALRWNSENTSSISLHKSGDSWVYDEDEAFPVDSEKINDMLTQFSSFTAAFIIESPEQLSAYGLDDPTAVIELETEDFTQEIRLGDFSAMDSQRYVSIGDGNVYLIQRDPMVDFDVSLQDLILHDKIPHFDQVQFLDFSGSDLSSIEHREQGGDSLREDDHYFTQHNDQEVPLDSGLVDGYLQDLSWTALHDYVTYNASEEELVKYGMDKPQLTVNVTYKDEDRDDEQAFVLHVSRDPEELTDADESNEETDEITAYARVGDSPIIYQISGADYENLIACTYNDLRHHEVLPVEYPSIAQIDVELDSTAYQLILKETDDAPVILYKDVEFDGADLQNALTALTAQEFTDASSREKSEVSMLLTLNDEASTTVKLSLDRYDGTQCLALVDDQPFALVDRSLVVHVIEAINAIVLNTTPVSVPG